MAVVQTLVLGEYLWILIVGAIAAFVFGFGTGSNDVANAFGTSVGSKTLTLAQATLIAIVFEFTGALVLGRVVQETIAGGIADISAFQTDPEFFAYGMMWALLVGGVWQIGASSIELNVSATHSIIGAIVGFAMAYKGRGAVIWASEQVVCTGPLVRLNPCRAPTICPGNQFRLMSFFDRSANKTAFLAATYTVQITDLFNATTGARRTPALVDAAWLRKTTGLNITAGSGTGPYTVDYPGYKLGQVQFNIKTASFDGHDLGCSGVMCPIEPQKSVPIVPYQTMYEPKIPICNVASNSQAPFPPFKGILPIVLAWFFAPILTGLASAALFLLSRHLVLRRSNPYKRSFILLPFLAFLTFWVNIFFVLTKGAAKVLSKSVTGWTTNKAAWISACIAGGVAFLTVVVIGPLMFLRVNRRFDELEQKGAADAAAEGKEDGSSPKALRSVVASSGDDGATVLAHHGLEMAGGAGAGERKLRREDFRGDSAAHSVVVYSPPNTASSGSDDATASAPADDTRDSPAAAGGLWGSGGSGSRGRKAVSFYLSKAKKAALHGVSADMDSIIDEDPLVAAIHARAEVFDEKAEAVFSYMQVFSAICVIFAHGAGEVGYMSGPLGAIYQVVRSGMLVKDSSPPIWTVIVGALGLVVGLATYGYILTRAVGTRYAKLTPSRGFAAELATSLVIMVASQYGLPTSSSQCITGGICGVALCEGAKGLNIKFFLQTFLSWVLTLVAVAAVTAFLFAQGAYAPSAQMSRQIGYYEEALSVRSQLLLKAYQQILSSSGYNVSDSNEQFAAFLSTSIANLAPGVYYQSGEDASPSGIYPHQLPPKVQTVYPWQMIGYLDTSLALLQQVVQPNPTGEMMCGAAAAAQQQPASDRFPWAAALTKGGAPASPCTGNFTLTEALPVPFTPVSFLGPNPNCPVTQPSCPASRFVDSEGKPVAFSGTVPVLLNRKGTRSNGDVTLDQFRITGATTGLNVPGTVTCLQAPCNVLYPERPWFNG